ncbi:MAG: ribonuclease HII [Thermoplasmatota archaeon]
MSQSPVVGSAVRPRHLIGVDEAGRGPVLGPLVVAGVSIPDDEPLRQLGVRDSKLCTPATRRRLGPRIRELCEQVVVKSIPPEQIDSYRARGSLNELEAETFAEVIRGLLTASLPGGPGRVDALAFVDAVDTDAQEFREKVLRHLGFRVELVSEHRADERYPVVSAASILAKLARDEEMERISREAGEDVGSGYPSDPVTVAYLERAIRACGAPPPHTRATWETVRKLLRRERRLDDFGGRQEGGEGGRVDGNA